MHRLAALGLALLLAAPAAARAADAPAGQQGGPAHSGSVRAGIAPPLGKRWVRADIGSPGTPIVYDGRVFVVAYGSDRDGGSSSRTSTLHALDAATGATLWSVPGVLGDVSAAAGLVFGRVGESVVARDAASGAVRWTVDDTGDYGPTPVADDEFVYLGGPGIRALRTSDGLEMWSASSSNSQTGPPGADAERAYVLGCGGAVLAVRRTLGLPAWEHSGGCFGGSNPRPPVIAAGRVWGEETVHRASDGTLLGPWQAAQPAVAADRTVVVDGSSLRAADLEGRTIWEAKVPGATDYLGDADVARPLIADGTVYALAGGDTVAGFDLRTGAERWRSTTRLSDPYRSSGSSSAAGGLAARGGRLIVPFADKLVAYAPGADAPGLDPDPWRDPSAVTLSLGRPSDATLRFGQRATIPVAYQRRVGEDEDGPALVLEADPFPFGGWETVGPVGGDESLGRTVRVKPDRNTRYRVRHDGVSPAKHSREVTVLTDVDLRVRYRFLSPTRLRARIALRAPADRLRAPARRRLFFYYFRRRGTSSRRLGIERLRLSNPTTAVGQIVLRVPRRWGRRDSVYPCLRERRDDGFGRYFRGQRDCGRRRF